jgi:hypothetical protein
MQETLVKQYLCAVSGKPIPMIRVEYLQGEGIPEDEWTLKEFSQVTKKKGIYMGEVSGSDGLEETGTLVVVSRVDNTSVRAILSGAESEDDDAA